MSTLYQISQTQADLTLTNWLAEGDAVILLGDACYALKQWQQALATCSTEAGSPKAEPITLHVRQPDLEQRGLSRPNAVSVIDDHAWVALTLSHSRTLSWS